MRVESGIKEGDRHAAAGESFICIHAQRRRQDEIILLKNCGVRFDLPFCAAKDFETRPTDFPRLAVGSGRFYDRL